MLDRRNLLVLPTDVSEEEPITVTFDVGEKEPPSGAIILVSSKSQPVPKLAPSFKHISQEILSSPITNVSFENKAPSRAPLP